MEGQQQGRGRMSSEEARGLAVFIIPADLVVLLRNYLMLQGIIENTEMR
jgi:hypothetical protein